MKAYIGIDVACAKGKYCPISICYKEGGKLIPINLADDVIQPPKGSGNISTLNDIRNREYANDIRVYITAVCNKYKLTPACIAIDSPLLPRKNELKRRLAEVELDKLRVNCYTTPSESDFVMIKAKIKKHLEDGGQPNKLPHSMQLFMLAGFAIADALKGVATCIEVYPHATAKLLGVADKHKTKDDQAIVQLRALSQHTGWPSSQADWDNAGKICKGPMHDKVDAYGAAWIASLPDSDRTILGDPDKNDAVYLPSLANLSVELMLNKLQPTKPIKKTVDTSSGNLVSDASSHHTKLCPACKMYTFKRWPLGWDSHAAHKCAGIVGIGTEQRKQEFKEKYL